MDTDKEKAMTIYFTDNPVKFIENVVGLYARLPNNLNNNNTTDHQKNVQFTTVEETLILLSPKQIERAKAARKYLYAIGTPSIQDSITAITTNLVKNNEITLKDIEIAEKAYGLDIGSIKEKTTRRNKKESDKDKVEIPQKLICKNQYFEISVNTINVNGLTFLSSINHELNNRIAQYIHNSKSSTFQQCLDN